MTTPAEQEAERRYPQTARMRFAFESGAAFEREQLRELLEAAREYREAKKNLKPFLLTGEPYSVSLYRASRESLDGAIVRLLAAAAALRGGHG